MIQITRRSVSCNKIQLLLGVAEKSGPTLVPLPNTLAGLMGTERFPIPLYLKFSVAWDQTSRPHRVPLVIRRIDCNFKPHSHCCATLTPETPHSHTYPPSLNLFRPTWSLSATQSRDSIVEYILCITEVGCRQVQMPVWDHHAWPEPWLLPLLKGLDTRRATQSTCFVSAFANVVQKNSPWDSVSLTPADISQSISCALPDGRFFHVTLPVYQHTLLLPFSICTKVKSYRLSSCFIVTQ